MYLESTARLAFLTLSCAIKAIQLKPECYLSSVILFTEGKCFVWLFFILFSLQNLNFECFFLSFSFFLLVICFRDGVSSKNFDVFFFSVKIENGGDFISQRVLVVSFFFCIDYNKCRIYLLR